MESGEDYLYDKHNEKYKKYPLKPDEVFKKPEFKPLEHLGGGQNKLIQDLILQSNSIGKLLDSTLARYEQALQLLIRCKNHMIGFTSEQQQLLKDLNKFLENGSKSD